MYIYSVFYNAEFCDAGELKAREGGGIALLTGTKVFTVTNV